MDTHDLSRFKEYLSIPVEDHAARARLRITDDEIDWLHVLLIKKEIPREFYYEVRFAKTADFIYEQDGRERGWTIAHIRKQQSLVQTRQFVRKGEEIHETISGRLWPKGWHIERVRSRKEPFKLVYEIELAFSPKADLDQLWKDMKDDLVGEGIQLLQDFPDNQLVQDLCFLPGSENMSAAVIVSTGERRKELVFPIARRYEKVLRQIASKYDLDLDKPSLGPPEPLQRVSSDELQVALTGLWHAARSYDKSKGIPVHPYLMKQVQWRMGEEFKRRSGQMEDPDTGKRRRMLRGDAERTGGSLGDSVSNQQGPGMRTLGETIADPHATPPDRRILLQQILDTLIDETDKQIVRLFLRGSPQREIAKRLRISQAAISKRLKRLGKNLQH